MKQTLSTINTDGLIINHRRKMAGRVRLTASVEHMEQESRPMCPKRAAIVMQSVKFRCNAARRKRHSKIEFFTKEVCVCGRKGKVFFLIQVIVFLHLWIC